MPSAFYGYASIFLGIIQNFSIRQLQLNMGFGIILIIILSIFLAEDGRRETPMEQKHVQRLIGIDFGTSTSLIRVKRYQGQ